MFAIQKAKSKTPTLVDASKNEKHKIKNKDLSFLRYLGLSFQLFGTIALGTYLGLLIQQQSKMKFPLWIILFCFLFTLISIYHLWKVANQKK